MTQRLKLSVFIIALNEADRIGDTIRSVQDWVDEVIVIDSGSKDDTVSVSEKLGASVYFNPWPGYGLQKRFGEDKCRNDWILNLDADEVVPETLKQEIIGLFNKGGPAHPAWKVRIVEILPGRRKPTPFAHYIAAIRLYNLRFGRFSDSTVHDTVRMEGGTVGELKNIVLHRSSRGITHTLEKINRYSTMQADNMIARGKRLSWPRLRLIFEFPIAFLKCYFLRGYVFAGRQGFVNAVIYGFSRFVRVAKYLEHPRRMAGSGNDNHRTLQ